MTAATTLSHLSVTPFCHTPLSHASVTRHTGVSSSPCDVYGRINKDPGAAVNLWWCETDDRSAVLRQEAVTAYLKSKQLLPIVFAEQSSRVSLTDRAGR